MTDNPAENKIENKIGNLAPRDVRKVIKRFMWGETKAGLRKELGLTKGQMNNIVRHARSLINTDIKEEMIQDIARLNMIMAEAFKEMGRVDEQEETFERTRTSAYGPNNYTEVTKVNKKRRKKTEWAGIILRTIEDKDRILGYGQQGVGDGGMSVNGMSREQMIDSIIGKIGLEGNGQSTGTPLIGLEAETNEPSKEQEEGMVIEILDGE